MNGQITLNIPDLDQLYKDEGDLRTFVTTTLSDVIVARLQSLKDMNAELNAAATKGINLEDPKSLRGIGITMGGMMGGGGGF